MINIGDKFLVVNKIVGFLNEGDIVEVTNVGENNMISFMFTGEKYKCEGSMSPSEFEKYFEKVAEAEADIYSDIMEQVEEIMGNSKFETCTVFGRCAVVSCELPNGFVIVESSICEFPYDYDEEYHIDVCFEKIADRISEMEAYRFQNELYLAKLDEDDCDCDCTNCGECHYDGCC